MRNELAFFLIARLSDLIDLMSLLDPKRRHNSFFFFLSFVLSLLMSDVSLRVTVPDGVKEPQNTVEVGTALYWLLNKISCYIF